MPRYLHGHAVSETPAISRGHPNSGADLLLCSWRRSSGAAMEAFENPRISDGLAQSRYPSSLVQMIPTFSLLWVGMVHDFWMYRDDQNFVRRQLPGTRAVLEWFLQRQRSDGLLGKIPWWPFVDWGKDFKSGEPPRTAMADLRSSRYSLLNLCVMRLIWNRHWVTWNWRRSTALPLIALRRQF